MTGLRRSCGRLFGSRRWDRRPLVVPVTLTVLGLVQASPALSSASTPHHELRFAHHMVARFAAPSGPDLVARRAEGALIAARNREAARAAAISADRHPSPAAVRQIYGDYAATPILPASRWVSGPSSGSFVWSYPMRVPPPAAGPAPKLGLSYDSGRVDGRTLATNNQASQVGEGFELSSSSYISRSYIPCHEEGHPSSYDLCWNSGQVTLVLNGKATALVQEEDSPNSYRLAQDDDSRVDLIRPGGDPSNPEAGEYWRLTTSDGTQYYFGRNKLPGTGSSPARTHSVDSVPVFGDDSGEPCNGATFAASSCSQAWRWNLDEVVDPAGNAMTYWYDTLTNRYRIDGGAPVPYDAGSHLTEIDYGLRNDDLFTDGEPTPAPEKVVFTSGERCTAGASCGSSPNDSWPDVPVHAICHKREPCTGNISPSFFTETLLKGVTTSVLKADGGYQEADSWTFNPRFLEPPDQSAVRAQVLWLSSVQHHGEDGDEITLPAEQFTPTWLPDRVVRKDDVLPPLERPRLRSIETETGGDVEVQYSGPACSATDLPKPGDNHRLCYPSYWLDRDAGQQTLGWFRKYVVRAVDRSDPNNPVPAPPIHTAYTYSNVAWHWADSPDEDSDHTTWSQWRGYRQVDTSVGVGAHLNLVADVYMQGMDGDHGDTGHVYVRGVDAPRLLDSNRLAGFHREHVVYLTGSAGAPGNRQSDEYFGPWAKQTAAQIFAAHGAFSALTVRSWLVRPGKDTTETLLYQPAGVRTRVMQTSYNADGLPRAVSDQGDVSQPGDESCTRTWYAVRNDADGYLTALPSRVLKLDLTCGSTNGVDWPGNSRRSGDVISDVTTLYDGQTDWRTQQPTQGEPTEAARATGYTKAGKPKGWQPTATNGYDALGRVTSTADADGNTTLTAYDPSGAGVPHQITVTRPLGLTTTNVLDPVRGSLTDTYDANGNHARYQYDSLGRLTAVWIASNPLGGPYQTFGYHVSDSAASWESTSTINAWTGDYTTDYAFYDAFLRQIQTQQIPANLDDAQSVGRLVSETIYGQRGNVYKELDDLYDTSSLPSSTMVGVAEGGVPTEIDTSYDGAKRPISHTYRYNDNHHVYSTFSTYDGRSVLNSAPQGGSATQLFTDALGGTTQVRVYNNEEGTGDYRSTTTSYLPTGEVGTITGSDRARTTYQYDLYGRRVSQIDPDSGTTRMGYDDLDQLTRVTDARGKVVRYAYDPLGRKSTEWAGAKTDDNEIASWAYDTADNGKGLLGSSTSYTHGLSGPRYTESVDSYDALDQPKTTTVTLPSDDDLVLSGAIPSTGATTTVDYNPADGQVQDVKNPAIGGLPFNGASIEYNASGMPISLDDVYGASYEPTGQLDSEMLTSNPLSSETAYLDKTYQPGTWRLATSDVVDMVHGFSAAWHTYTYDDAGNLLEDADSANLGGTGHAEYRCYAYNGYRQLVQAWTPSHSTDTCDRGRRSLANLAGAAPYWRSYTYSPGGQRASLTDHTSGGDVTTDYTYGGIACTGADRPARHVLTQATVEGGGSSTYGCDAAGNTTSRPGPTNTEQLTWDGAGRLASVEQAATGSKPATSTHNIYDANGNLLIRRVTTGRTTTSTLFDGWNEVHAKARSTGGYDVSAERLIPFAGQTAEVVTAHPDGTIGVYFAFPDPQGTSELLLQQNPSMTINKRYFLPFGGPARRHRSWPDDRRFLGKPFNSSTGLSNLGARFYDPAVGAFLSRDTVVDSADPLDLNGYSYADNNPAAGSDPDGSTALPAWPVAASVSEVLGNPASWPEQAHQVGMEPGVGLPSWAEDEHGEVAGADGGVGEGDLVPVGVGDGDGGGLAADDAAAGAVVSQP